MGHSIMNQGFSPVLAHLLMAGLARRALLKDTSAIPSDPHPSDDALDWGIAAFVSGNTTGRHALQTFDAAEITR